MPLRGDSDVHCSIVHETRDSFFEDEARQQYRTKFVKKLKYYYAVAGSSYRQGRAYRPTIFVWALPLGHRSQRSKSKISIKIFHMFNHMIFACYMRESAQQIKD